MSKRNNVKHKISRRYGVNLWGRDNDPSEKRNYIPGQHGPMIGKRVMSDFGKQLAAKQMLKGYYGNISEKQFRNTFKEASSMKGDASENFIGLLERRLDATIYRMNFVPTVFAARQFVSHKHVKVNGKKVNVASYRLKDGDEIELVEKARTIPMVIEASEAQSREVPAYMEADVKAFKGKYIRTAVIEEVPYPFQAEVSLIVEFYKR